MITTWTACQHKGKGWPASCWFWKPISLRACLGTGCAHCIFPDMCWDLEQTLHAHLFSNIERLASDSGPSHNIMPGHLYYSTHLGLLWENESNSNTFHWLKSCHDSLNQIRFLFFCICNCTSIQAQILTPNQCTLEKKNIHSCINTSSTIFHKTATNFHTTTLWSE